MGIRMMSFILILEGVSKCGWDRISNLYGKFRQIVSRSRCLALDGEYRLAYKCSMLSQRQHSGAFHGI